MTRLRISGHLRELNYSDKKVPGLATHMPVLVTHAGLWQGDFQHYSPAGKLLETHQATVEHQFPDQGRFAHIQKSHFIWDNGQEHRLTQKSVFKIGKLWWKSGPFEGCVWETDFQTVLVNITQATDPKLSLTEMICLEPNGQRRSRVRQWFKDGALFKRTLCYERRISNEGAVS